MAPTLRASIGPMLVLVFSVGFAIWFLPSAYIDPRSTDWIFKESGPFIDGSGHAIQAMFFAAEPWDMPLGRFHSFGGPVGASLIMAAVSPLFAFPVKMLEAVGAIGPFWQFVGLQGILGICTTALSVYWLSRELRASRLASVTVAVLSVPLPNLFVLAAFNETLSWQCLVVFPMILLLRDRDARQPGYIWALLFALAVWTNTYYVAMALPFYFVHLGIARIRHRQRLASSAMELALVVA